MSTSIVNCRSRTSGSAGLYERPRVGECFVRAAKPARSSGDLLLRWAGELARKEMGELECAVLSDMVHRALSATRCSGWDAWGPRQALAR
jgi:hypothetical protein